MLHRKSSIFIIIMFCSFYLCNVPILVTSCCFFDAAKLISFKHQWIHSFWHVTFHNIYVINHKCYWNKKQYHTLLGGLCRFPLDPAKLNLAIKTCPCRNGQHATSLVIVILNLIQCKYFCRIKTQCSNALFVYM